MEAMRNRATELLPSVLLTVLSMIQALALELFWVRLRESSYLWTPGWEALLGWSQAAAMLLGFLVVWLFFSVVMRFRWLPSIQDSVVPFGIGVLEFSLIDLMGPDSLGPWFYLLALIFAVSTWTSQSIFRRARQDPANREFFDSVESTPLTIEQRRASVVMEDRNLLVASAGSGKTSTVVAKVGYALMRGLVRPEEILVVAFNAHAAAELEERVHERLGAWINGPMSVKAKTFHAFGLEVIAAAEYQHRFHFHPGRSSRRSKQHSRQKDFDENTDPHLPPSVVWEAGIPWGRLTMCTHDYPGSPYRKGSMWQRGSSLVARHISVPAPQQPPLAEYQPAHHHHGQAEYGAETVG